ncbi:type II toxin-antitoxin system Phd/YefM family antitoxin [Streptomyces sp. NPDC060188]|uniref:type II toxin-antitoxin system Phd/YefM family antitoxin n=1 Tax=Streptomyces sp. NPDC060188 TaxID=3347068 RepID=UPI00364C1C53
MAADQGIQIADDGVAEVSMTSARANLTQLLRDVRYGKRSAAFTERGARSAYVVPPEFYEEAQRNREVLDRLRGFVGMPPGTSAADNPELLERSRVTHDLLTEAGFSFDD